jgi:hypothetical protein
MRNRGEIGSLIEGLQKDQALLAAFLEAADKIDWQDLHRPVASGETPKPVNLEAHAASPFAFRRANLVRISE